MRTLERVLSGLTLVALGFIFLGTTLGFLPWSTGDVILSLISLWPVLLVTAGLDIIGRGLNAPWLRVLGSALALGAVLYGGLVLPAAQSRPTFFGIVGRGSSHPYSYSASTGSVEEATISVKGGAGEIDVSDGQSGELVRMSGESPFDNPFMDVERNGSTANVTASMGSGPTAWPLWSRSSMNLWLSPAVTWDVQLETGAAALMANLRDVPIKALRLKTGVSSSDITFGDVPFDVQEVPVRVESGVAAVTLRIPSDAEARVEAQTGLSSVSVPSDLSRQSEGGRVYESPGYSSASHRYLIHVQTGLGSVDVRRY